MAISERKFVTFGIGGLLLVTLCRLALVFTFGTDANGKLLAAVPPVGSSVGRTARGNFIPAVQAGGGGGGGCTTTADTYTGTTVSTSDCGGSKYVATTFLAGSSYTVCKAIVRMKTASGTGSSYTMTCAIYSNNGGTTYPSAIVGTGSGTINANTVNAVEADITFTGMSAALSSGTRYWVVVISASEFNSTPAGWAAMSQTQTHGVVVSSDGSAWSDVDDFSVQKFTLYQ